MTFNVDYFWESIRYGIKYIPFTLQFSVIVFVLSVLFGLIIATIRFYKVPVLSQFFSGFITLYLGVPLILAINIYYVLYATYYNDIAGILGTGKTIRDANFTSVAYFTLILSYSCMISETFRGAYRTIDKTQFEAGYAIGLTKLGTLRRIIFPQVVPAVLPSMVNWLVGTIKGTSFVSIIGLYEVMNGALIPCINTYSYVEGYVAAALIYWGIVVIIEQVGKLVEKRSARFRRQTV
ncbi:amino acid ABC transporter permease [Butyrivibrio sp. WCE2006]|uniref:amino acid ABC transporter permease n=1 Tax=Butyrivibrio sp. WCE2006 TaxID=1410611 RepID=UPI0005D195FD|nr:ABC transporter permease subunit [Butyrivibrio sp. WCE2006]